jgi:hypothetical protein
MLTQSAPKSVSAGTFGSALVEHTEKTAAFTPGVKMASNENHTTFEFAVVTPFATPTPLPNTDDQPPVVSPTKVPTETPTESPTGQPTARVLDGSDGSVNLPTINVPTLDVGINQGNSSQSSPNANTLGGVFGGLSLGNQGGAPVSVIIVLIVVLIVLLAVVLLALRRFS